MGEQDLNKFLDKKPGYIKFGSKAIMKILKAKGYALNNLTQDQIKEVLRLRAAGYVPTSKKKTVKILTYDIETSLVEAQLWGSGKQYVGHDAITTETQIITVAWKWLGEEKVNALEWDMNAKSDQSLVKKFLKVYNKADMVIGWNNNTFDNKIVNSRAMKYNLNVNVHVKSFDIMRKVKQVFRLPSYSMAYVSRYLGLSGKLDYSGGIRMWKDIQWGPMVDALNAMKTMVAYNVQDVALTEEIYFRLRKYLGHVINVGAMQGSTHPITCPHCGSHKVKLHHSSTTPASTIQRIMVCKKDGVMFKTSNIKYLKTL